MRQLIYFDNAASSSLCEGAKTALREEMEFRANPSSLHRLGFEAEKRLTRAREAVAAGLHALPEEIVFTAGGSEANNLAILGAARANKRQGRRIVSTDSEHPSVEEVLKSLETDGFEVVRLKTAGGRLDEA